MPVFPVGSLSSSKPPDYKFFKGLIQDGLSLRCSEVYFDNLLIVHRRISSKVSAVFSVYSLWLVLRVFKEELWHDSWDVWTVPEVLLRITSLLECTELH